MSINFLNEKQITDLVTEALNQGKKIMYRQGLDFRFSGKDGAAIRGSKRNKEITLEGLMHQAHDNFIGLEEDECTNEQIVFHGYSCLDME